MTERQVPLGPIMSIATVFVFVVLGIALGGNGEPTSDAVRDADANTLCQRATMVLRRDDRGDFVGTAYGASQLQRTDNSYITCENGIHISAQDGHRL